MRVGFQLPLHAIGTKSVGIIYPTDNCTKSRLTAVVDAHQMPGVVILSIEINIVIRDPDLIAGGIVPDLRRQCAHLSIFRIYLQSTVGSGLCLTETMRSV